LKFSPDSKKIVVCTAMSSLVVIFDLGSSTSEDGDERTVPRVIRTFDHHRMQNIILGDRVISGGPIQTNVGEAEESEAASDVEDSSESRSSPTLNTFITKVTMSYDGQWLVTTDDRRRVYVFNMDSMQHQCVLPTFPQAIQALSFDPSSPNTLVIGLADNTIHIYDVESRSFPEWCRELCNNLPKRFTHVHDSILGLTFDPAGQEGSRKALFWGSTWMCSVRLDAPVGWGGFSKKRRRKSGGLPSAASGLLPSYSTPTQRHQLHVHPGDQHHRQQQNFTMITHYRPILFVDFLGAGGELVVIERPLVDVLAKLPPAYFKPKYGAT
jgi:U3 small nucleolar RNA-associated protein 4